MTKICIIEVELSKHVDLIISRTLTEISGESKKQLNAAIDLAKSIKKQKEDKLKQKTEIIDKMELLVKQLYIKIEQSGATGLPASEVEAALGTNMTLSAFTTRMKTLLRKEGNKYAITKENRLGVPHYVFISYNI